MGAVRLWTLRRGAVPNTAQKQVTSAPSFGTLYRVR